MDEPRNFQREDEIWRAIVENYGERVALGPEDDLPTSPGTGSGDALIDPADPEGANAPAAAEDPPGAAAASNPFERAWMQPIDLNSPAADEDSADPDDHFVPPPAEAVGRPEPPRLLAWLGVLGAPLVLVLLVATNWSPPHWLNLIGLIWFLAGFGYLVVNLRNDDDDDLWDDGARL